MGHKSRSRRQGGVVARGFRKETIAGLRHNGRDAPIADLLAPTKNGGASNESCHLPCARYRPPLPIGRRALARTSGHQNASTAEIAGAEVLHQHITASSASPKLCSLRDVAY